MFLLSSEIQQKAKEPGGPCAHAVGGPAHLPSKCVDNTGGKLWARYIFPLLWLKNQNGTTPTCWDVFYASFRIFS